MGWADDLGAREVCRSAAALAFGRSAVLTVDGVEVELTDGGILRWVDAVSPTGVSTRREVYDVADEVLEAAGVSPTSDPDALTTIAIGDAPARLVVAVERGPQGKQRLILGREAGP